jgi:hypothetical protein
MQSTQKFIIRTVHAGVFYGEIAERRGDEADLTNARRIYEWHGAATLSQVSQDGVGPNSKLTMPVNLTVLGVIEIIPVSDKAQENLDGQEVWKL